MYLVSDWLLQFEKRSLQFAVEGVEDARCGRAVVCIGNNTSLSSEIVGPAAFAVLGAFLVFSLVSIIVTNSAKTRTSTDDFS
jgi:hypothetical protein